ncbi:GNAT family N-acetyltransferase [Streptomyces sviceus]|uniref:GNAT family N-acetyltransferase n=1 Tax=Streptomyces sviceus TaxID=285530 RepID=UPI003804BF3E
MITPIPPVVPAGRMADNAQPVLALPGGLELRPWHTEPAAADRGRGTRAYRADAGAVGEGDSGGVGGRAGGRGEGAGVLSSTGIGLAAGSRDEHAKNPGPGDILGLAAWIDVDLDRGHAEIAYWALHDLGLHRLTLCHALANEASCRVAEKAGFRLEGTMRHALLHADGRHDQHLHARVRGDDQNDLDDLDDRGNERT